MKVLPLLFFLILSFSQGLNAKETCDFQEPSFSTWAEKVVDGAIDLGLTLLGGDEAKALWFCEDPHDSKTCHERAVFERHRVKDPEILKITAGFAGRMQGTNDRRASNKSYKKNVTVSAFLFETEKCPKNRFVITNAHFKYNSGSRGKKLVSEEARFCLNSSDGKKMVLLSC